MTVALVTISFLNQIYCAKCFEFFKWSVESRGVLNSTLFERDDGEGPTLQYSVFDDITNINHTQHKDYRTEGRLSGNIVAGNSNKIILYVHTNYTIELSSTSDTTRDSNYLKRGE